MTHEQAIKHAASHAKMAGESADRAHSGAGDYAVRAAAAHASAAAAWASIATALQPLQEHESLNDS